MPTVPIKVYCVAGLRPHGVPVGVWYNKYGFSADDRAVQYTSAIPGAEANAKMRGAMLTIHLDNDYNFPLHAEDGELVEVDLVIPEGAQADDMYEGTVTYPDSWHGAQVGAEIWVGNIKSGFFLKGPKVITEIKGTENVNGFDWEWNAERNRETKLHMFRFIGSSYLINATRLGYGSATYHFDWGNGTSTEVSSADMTPFEVSTTLAETGGSVSVYSFDEYGQRSATLHMKLPPFAIPVVVDNEDGRLFRINLSQCYDPDSDDVHPGDSYTGPGNQFYGPDADGYWRIDLRSTIHTFVDDTTYQYRFFVFDGETPTISDWVNIPLEIKTPRPLIGSHVDHTKTHYTAVALGEDVQIYKFTPGRGSRKELFKITGYTEPQLWGNEHGELFCSCQQTLPTGIARGEYHVFSSRDYGRSWTKVQDQSMWNPEHFRKGGDCALAVGGGAASVAIKRGFETRTQIYFKYSKDGLEWPSDEDAILVGDNLTPSPTPVLRSLSVFQVPGRTELRITDGINRVWRSMRMGAKDSWEVLP